MAEVHPLDHASDNNESSCTADILDERTALCAGTYECRTSKEFNAGTIHTVAKVAKIPSEKNGADLLETDGATRLIAIFDTAPLLLVVTTLYERGTCNGTLPDTEAGRVGPTYVPKIVLPHTESGPRKKTSAASGEKTLVTTDHIDCNIRFSPGDGVVVASSELRVDGSGPYDVTSCLDGTGK